MESRSNKQLTAEKNKMMGFRSKDILPLKTKAFLLQRTQRKPEKKVISPQF
jgi:hypothetical protein